MMKRSIFSFLLIGLYLTALGQSDLQKIKSAFFNPDSKYVLVAAHRSAHNHAPENSLKAMQHAIDAGVDIIEMDVRLTKDKVPVIMHDDDIRRTATGQGAVEDYTLAQLKKFYLKDGGAITNGRFPHSKRPW